MIFFLCAHLVIFFYLLFRVVLPLDVSGKMRVFLALLLLVTSQHYLVRFAFGNLSSPEIPRVFIIIEGWCFATVLGLFLLVLARDCLLLLRRIFGGSGRKKGTRRIFSGKFPGKKNSRHSSGRRKAVLALTAMAAAPAAYGVKQGIVIPPVRERSAELPNLPRELEGLTIAHITDLHVTRLFGPDWLQAVVERVNAIKPDLILFTGDMIDGQPELRTMDVLALGELRAKYGVYGCVGNHEYYSGYRFWMSRLRELGMTMLENGHRIIEINGKELVVVGVTDPVAVQFGLPEPDIAAALAGAPASAFKIMLDHRPAAFARHAAAGADLVLSGHTHGGHVLGMDRLVARINNGYVYGWYAAQAARMYVSSGAGLWDGFPVRLGVDSEIAKITLQAPAFTA